MEVNLTVEHPLGGQMTLVVPGPDYQTALKSAYESVPLGCTVTEISSTRTPVDANNRLVAVGKVVENSKAVEVSLHFLLAGFISANIDVADTVAAGNATQQLRVLETLTKLSPLADTTKAQIAAWIKDSRTAFARRNAVVHSAWVVEPDGTESEISKGRTKPLDTQSLPSLAETAEMLAALLPQATALMQLLSREDCWFGLPSQPV